MPPYNVRASDRNACPTADFARVDPKEGKGAPDRLVHDVVDAHRAVVEGRHGRDVAALAIPAASRSSVVNDLLDVLRTTADLMRRSPDD